MSTESTPKKVAILGGGVGALATALELTDDAGWRQRFDSITVYQMGWRLGGKGASGRGDYGRIEEHGLHVWMGFYENAFAAIRRVYKELDRPPGAPLATWQDAFKQHDFIVLAEQYRQAWRLWPLELEANTQRPGDGLPLPSLWDHCKRALSLLATMTSGAEHADDDQPHGLKEHVLEVLHELGLAAETAELRLGAGLLRVALAAAERLEGHPATHDPKHHDVLVELIDRFNHWYQQRYRESLDDDELRHAFVLTDFGTACLRGVFVEGLLTGNVDFDGLDGEDMVAWLKKHGASDVTCRSGLIHGMYDLMLAYRDGDARKPSFGAGTCLHFIIRMALTYRGSVFWKMQAGMGDTIFAPLYQVLKRRGVEFKFFHRVERLRVSDDGAAVDGIDLAIQATPGDNGYDPLVDVNGLPCWPSTPRYEQLEQGVELRDGGYNLESFWSGWRDVGSRTLRRGEDFDVVVLGIPVGSHPYLCSELIAANSAWKDMVERVETTRTLALQLWLKPDLQGLGWSADSPVMDSYVQPFNTWADMSQLIGRERWPADAPVGNIAYFCGPMAGGIPAADDVDAPRREKQAVKDEAISWLQTRAGFLWPDVADDDGALRWSALVDPKDRDGVQRLDAQFWRANIDPSERYVLSLPGSTQYRLRSDNTYFDNLIIAGDWTWNPLNAGCVEATMMSGMMAANVMLGREVSHGIAGYQRS